MRKLLLGAATIVTSLGLTAGVAAAQTGGGNIRDTGPDSSATINTKVGSKTQVNTENDLSVSDTNNQTGWSGDAGVFHNTRGGSATSGAVKNSRSFSLSAAIDNNTAQPLAAAMSGPSGATGGGSISDTGPNSSADINTRVHTSTEVNTANTLSIDSSSTQSGYSGNAEVSGNTHGGDATSGPVSNSSTSSVTIHITN